MRPFKHFVVGSLLVLLITVSTPTGNAWPWSNDDKQRRLEEEIQSSPDRAATHSAGGPHG